MSREKSLLYGPDTNSESDRPGGYSTWVIVRLIPEKLVFIAHTIENIQHGVVPEVEYNNVRLNAERNFKRTPRISAQDRFFL